MRNKLIATGCLAAILFFCQCVSGDLWAKQRRGTQKKWSQYDGQTTASGCNVVDSVFFFTLSQTIDTVDVINSEANLLEPKERFEITLFQFDQNGKFQETGESFYSDDNNKYLFVDPIISCCGSKAPVYIIEFNNKQFIFTAYYPTLFNRNGSKRIVRCTNLYDTDETIKYETFYKKEIFQYLNNKFSVVKPDKSEDKNIQFIYE